MKAAALGLLAAATAAWQAALVREALRRGRAEARLARPFERPLPGAPRRVLVVGDSTGVGVGAGCPEASLPGLLAAAYPGVEIVNRCASGARTADVPAQVHAAGAGFDLALVLVGGNDVLRATPRRRLAADARALVARLRRAARRTVWLGSANLAGSPLLKGPLAWWLGWNSGRTMALLAREARAAGAEFIDFWRPVGEDLFARRAGTYFARDGVHPGAPSYRHCFEVLRRQAPLGALLSTPRQPEYRPWPPYPTS
jgi:lysophospholipase L1-like esterase